MGIGKDFPFLFFVWEGAKCDLCKYLMNHDLSISVATSIISLWEVMEVAGNLASGLNGSLVKVAAKRVPLLNICIYKMFRYHLVIF